MLVLLLSLVASAGLPQPVADAVALGNCSQVARLLPDPTTPGERLVAGFCAESLGTDPTPHLEALDGLHAEYARLILARHAAHTEDWAAVEPLVDALELPGVAGEEVRLLRGRARVALGRSLEARPDLRSLLDGEVGTEARFWLAVGGEDRGDRAPAIATYRRVWIDGVQGPWSERAAQRLKGLGAPVPDASTTEGRGLIQERIATLRRAHRYPEALELLELLGPSPLALARARFDARAYDDAHAGFSDVLGPPSEATGSANDLYEYALASIRGPGDHAAALSIYERLLEQHPRHDRADLAAFKLGYTAYDAGRCPEAEGHFDDFVESRPDSPRVDEALWFSAWCAYREGRVEQARARWRRLKSVRPRSSLVSGTVYWLARSADDDDALAEVIRRWPTSGHAWLAAARLGRTFPARPEAKPPGWPEDLAGREDVRRAQTLADLGLDAWARDELKPVLASVEGKEAVLAAAWALIEVGEYAQARRIAKPYCVAPWEDGDPVAQQACTPRPESSIVREVAERFDVPPLLPYAIMNAESALQPGVTSIAGARGLMQLMPDEAGRIHQAVWGEDFDYHPDQLYLAPYNASLGTTELGLKKKELGDLLDGPAIPAVIASYNGGAEAVRRWRGDAADAPAFDTFTEDIGYTETRQYVKRVLGFWMAYRWVYGDP